VITVKEIEEKSVWEDFNLNSSNPTFLQSWAWGEFQKSLGRVIHRLGIYKDAGLVGIALLIEERARLASFIYCPGGPVFREWKKEYLNHWVTTVSETAKEKNFSFLRIDPRKLEKPKESLIKSSGFVSAPEYTQPRCTGIIDLTKNENEILSKTTPSTRNNIRASQRKGVVVREGKSEEIKTFLKLLTETSQRKRLILPREHRYHQKQFEILDNEGLMKLYIAESQGQGLSASLVVFYAGTAYYLHAASSDQMAKLRASYPLVWHTVLEAKKRNLRRFDFWGVAENDSPRHPWAGVTSFKLSFGAERECYEPPFDLPYKASYRLVRWLETYRRPLQKIFRFGRR